MNKVDPEKLYMSFNTYLIQKVSKELDKNTKQTKYIV